MPHGDLKRKGIMSNLTGFPFQEQWFLLKGRKEGGFDVIKSFDSEVEAYQVANGIALTEHHSIYVAKYCACFKTTSQKIVPLSKEETLSSVAVHQSLHIDALEKDMRYIGRPLPKRQDENKDGVELMAQGG